MIYPVSLQKERGCLESTLLKLMAGLTGLEPATSGVTGRHSNQLSYNPLLLLCHTGHGTEFLVAILNQLFRCHLLQLCQMLADGRTHGLGSGFVVTVGATCRFMDDLVDHAQLDDILGRWL
jgi:hypothetical protein